MKNILWILFLGYKIMWNKLDVIPDVFRTKQIFSVYEQRKRASTQESYVSAGNYLMI